ncbi:MAG: peroxiredoxin [Bryobacteraceae bacterium]|nr:peroxiredoxin [Bryobacteraceae bacterium]
MLSWLFSDPLPVGADAPDFALPDERGQVVRLSELRGSNVILVFYPGDETPVCTRQLCEFRDSWDQVRTRNAVVYGVNAQGAESHRRFAGNRRLPFPLLVDKGQKVGELYHTRGLVVKRTVYLIGPDGKVRYARRGKPSPAEVLAAAV